MLKAMSESIKNVNQDNFTFLQKWLESEVDSSNWIFLRIQFTYDNTYFVGYFMMLPVAKVYSMKW
jgi:hypothetical protein